MSATVLSFAPSTKILQSNNNNTIVLSDNKKLDLKRLKKAARVANPSSISVARRNARERNRVKQVNHGFATLRQHIPPEITALFEQQVNGKPSNNKKLSKVETLRMAVEYIRSLEDILDSKTRTPSTSSYDSLQSPQRYPSYKTEDEENIQPEFFEDTSLTDFAFEDSLQQSSILSSPTYYSDESLSPNSSGENTMYQPFVTLPPIEVIQHSRNIRNKEIRQQTSVITSVPSKIIFYTDDSFSGNVYIKTESEELGMHNGLVKSEEMINVMDWWDQNGTQQLSSPEGDNRVV